MDTFGDPADDTAGFAFDAVDTARAGVLPADRFETILENLGETFSGDELERERRRADPSSTGTLTRASFSAWYNRFITEGALAGGAEEYGDPAEALARASRLALPEGWSMHEDEATGHPMFFCEATGETSWDAPEGAHDPGPPDAPAGAASGLGVNAPAPAAPFSASSVTCLW